MGLMDFLLKSKSNSSERRQNPDSLTDEFVWLTTMVARATENDPHFIDHTHLQLAAASDAYGSDGLLLNGPSAFRISAIELSEKEARAEPSKESPEYLGLKLFNLWLRAQQDNSDEAREIFLGLCGPMFEARKRYYGRLRDKHLFTIRRIATVGMEEVQQFQNLKNFMLLRELGAGCTSQHLVGCIIGYADVYLAQAGLQAPRERDYLPLITEERLAKVGVIRGAYLRDGSVLTDSMKLVETGRIHGAKAFRETLTSVLAGE